MSEEPDSTSPSTESRSWLKRLGAAFSGEPTTRGDVLEFLRDAEAEGLLDADTVRMMEGAIAVSELTVGDVMIPRAQMTMIQIDQPMREVISTAVESGHSRFPVHGEDKDQIIGILLAKDLLRSVVAESPVSLHDLLRPAFLIPESKRLDLLLREFRLSRNHMAIVIDEYGGVAGVVTIEDVLEQIVGEIDDEHDDEALVLLEEEDGVFAAPGRMDLDDFEEATGVRLADPELAEEVDTLGGLLFRLAGRVPAAGEEVAHPDGHVFEVIDADSRRVNRLRARLKRPETGDRGAEAAE